MTSREQPAARDGAPAGLRGSKIVVTGVTGQVGGPVARALATSNDVYGAARFADAEARRQLEDAGVHCVRVDLASGDVGGLPPDADYVLHFAVSKSNDWDTDLAANVGGALSLMEHHRSARAFLHCSTTAVYRPNGHKDLTEAAPLGDNHGVWQFLRTYSIAKIGTEGAVRWAARRWRLPTTIGRLSVPYGPSGGWPALHLEMILAGSPVPVHEDAPSEYNPIYEDEILRTVPALLEAASVPATTVNWGGDEVVSIEEWCGYLAELAGTTARFQPTDRTIESVRVDTTALQRLAGKSQITWQEGMRSMVAARHPELLGS